MKFKNLVLTLAAISILPMASIATPTATVKVTGTKAEAVAFALLGSGFKGVLRNGVRSVNVSSLVIMEGIGNHECDDLTDLACGFTLPADVTTAQQNGKDIEVIESIQLTHTLGEVVVPVLMNKGITNSDSGAGHTYSNFGQISCTWKITTETPHAIKNASCTFVVPNYEH